MQLAPLKFTEWFNKLLKDYNLGVREAARKIKISHPMVSDLQNAAKPTEGTCVKIAIAFDYPTDFVLSLAGYRQQAKDPNVELITYLAEQLPTTEDKEDAAEYIRLRLRIAEERGKYGTTDKKRDKN